jgi:6-phosphogluconolactonase
MKRALVLLAIGACSESSSPSSAGSDGSAPAQDGAIPEPDGSVASDGSAPPDTGTVDASVPDAATLGPPRVYVGASDGKIHVYSFDTTTYALTPTDTVAAGQNPSFLAFDPTRKSLYAVDENASQVQAFAWDAKTGKLTALGAVGSGGNGPAHVSVDRTGAYVMAANYGGGTIAVFPRGADGKLGAPTATRSFGQNAHSHEIVTDPTNAFVFVVNLGLDAVAVFRLQGGGVLADAGLVPAGGGARHVAFDPAGTHAYVIDETASTITAFTFDPGAGTLTQIQQLSSLPPGTNVQNTGAEIQVTPDGKHVLASNRGDDSIVTFDIGADAKLTYKARTATGGQTPRHFQIDPTGRFLFVGNQTSGSVVAMKLDPTTGVPSPVGSPVQITGPEYVGLVYLDQ